MKAKTIGVSVLIAVIFSLAMLGKDWSSDGSGVKAQTFPTTVPTIPTQPPSEKPQPTEEPAKASCIFGTIEPQVTLDLFVPLKRNPKLIWGGAMNPNGSACSEAVEMVCTVPVHLLPRRPQLRYHREAILVRQYVKGIVDNTPSCAEKTIYFDLTRAERLQYDKDPSRIGIYWYNPEEKTWQECGGAALDAKVEPYGQLSCQTKEWGYFALGWPAKK